MSMAIKKTLLFASLVMLPIAHLWSNNDTLPKSVIPGSLCWAFAEYRKNNQIQKTGIVIFDNCLREMQFIPLDIDIKDKNATINQKLNNLMDPAVKNFNYALIDGKATDFGIFCKKTSNERSLFGVNFAVQHTCKFIPLTLKDINLNKCKSRLSNDNLSIKEANTITIEDQETKQTVSLQLCKDMSNKLHLCAQANLINKAQTNKYIRFLAIPFAATLLLLPAIASFFIARAFYKK